MNLDQLERAWATSPRGNATTARFLADVVREQEPTCALLILASLRAQAEAYRCRCGKSTCAGRSDAASIVGYIDELAKVARERLS